MRKNLKKLEHKKGILLQEHLKKGDIMGKKLLLAGVLASACVLVYKKNVVENILRKYEDRRASRNIYLDNITLDVYDDF